MGNRILLTWNYDPNMTCDYVIKWCNSSQSGPCLMDWKKIPSNSTETVIESGRCLSEFFKDIFKIYFLSRWHWFRITSCKFRVYTIMFLFLYKLQRLTTKKKNFFLRAAHKSFWLQCSDCSPSPLGWLWIGLTVLESSLWQYVCEKIHRLWSRRYLSRNVF